MTYVVDLFLQLVNIPSPLDKVGAMQRFLTDFIRRIYPEAKIAEDEAGKGNPLIEFEAGNILVSIPASAGCDNLPTLAVEAHVDTVLEEKKIVTVAYDYRITSAGNTILGADDKAGLAAICAALVTVKDVPHGPIEVIFSVGEESSMYGMKEFDFSQLKAKEILCVDGFQPSHIINSCAGKIKYRAAFHGKATHGAEPEKGTNAIYLAAQAITNCLVSGLSGRLSNGIIHNIAEIQSHEGPSQYPSNNTIPGICNLSGELRGLNSEILQNTFESVESLMKTVAAKYGGTVEFQTLTPYKPFFLGSQSAIIKRIKSKNPETAFVCESCDGSTHSNIYNEKGMQSVVIGAGCRNPHSHEESVIINEMTEARAIIHNYLAAPPLVK